MGGERPAGLLLDSLRGGKSMDQTTGRSRSQQASLPTKAETARNKSPIQDAERHARKNLFIYLAFSGLKVRGAIAIIAG
jgi:hypothetical protein